MNKDIDEMFKELDAVRNQYFSSEIFNGNIYKRAEADKWSVGEVVYHCYLLLKLTRLVSEIYLPASKMIRRIGGFKVKVIHDTMDNIYAGQTMNAPRILNPSMKREYSKGELRLMLESETEKILNIVRRLNNDDRLWIRYPDPVPGYPNVIQTIMLLKIHEMHHYRIVTEIEKSQEGKRNNGTVK